MTVKLTPAHGPFVATSTESVTCDACNGSGEGMYNGATCYKCDGRGEILEHVMIDETEDDDDEL